MTALRLQTGGRFESRTTGYAVTFVFVLAACALFGCSNGPDVNEAHYLGKALHYWNPSWCEDDFFVNSADAHLVFYWVFGWVPAVVGLETASITGRLIAWVLLSVSWLSLCRALRLDGVRTIVAALLWLGLVRWCHLSGEWIVGGIEAKGLSLPFAIWGAAAVVKGQWGRAYILLGISTSLHVLVGGWTFGMAGMSQCFLARKELLTVKNIKWLACGIALALPGLVPALLLNHTASNVDVALANDIYVFKRLPHHLVFSNFDIVRVSCGAGLLLGWMGWFIWRNRTRENDSCWKRWDYLVFGSILFAAIGLVLSAVMAPSRSGAGVLRYYWFRSFDVFVPAVLATGFASLPRLKGSLQLAIVVGICTFMALEQRERWRDGRSLAAQQSMPQSLRKDPEARRKVTFRIWRDWVLACRWIKQNTPDDIVVLTPRRQQTFKWHAHRAEVVNWKDIPQDANGLIEWNRRMEIVYTEPVIHKGFEANAKHVRWCAETYQFDYVVATHFVPAGDLGWERVYPGSETSPQSSSSFYVVYRVNRDSVSDDAVERSSE